MSKNVVVSAVTKKLTVAADVVAGVYRTTLSGTGTLDVTQDSADPTTTFSGVAPGDYSVSMVRMDANGVQLGDAATASFTVPADTVDVDVPDTVTVTLS